jgi:hypothetical protein
MRLGVVTPWKTYGTTPEHLLCAAPSPCVFLLLLLLQPHQ